MRIVFLFLLLLIPITVAGPTYNEITGDYRPLYNFSYSVFEELPPFPQDFFTRKSLLDYGQVDASRLTEEYYSQPEMFPLWENFANKTYSDQINRTQIGVYGVGAYPSTFYVYSVKEGDIFQVSSIIHAAWGVELYQGVHLYAVHKDGVEVRFLTPDTLLFTPTYPKFHRGWSVLTVLEIKVLRTGNYTITIKEEVPDSTTDSQWRNTYGDFYVSGGSILGLRVPKFKVYINGGETEESITNDGKSDNNFVINPFWIILLIIVGSYYVARRVRKYKERKKEKDS